MDKAKNHIICFLLCLSSICFAQPDIQFQHLSVADGLSVSNVNGLLQDNKGFMWFGTSNGLNKYDGYRFSVYYYDPSDSLSISANNINDIIEDRNGDLWIGTFKGLNRYNRRKDNFTRYKHQTTGNSIISNVVQCLLLDDSNNIWIGTEVGLTKFDTQRNVFTNYQHAEDDPSSLRNGDISVLMKDRKGRVWVGTRGGGLEEFDPAKGNFIHHQNNSKGARKNNDILDLHEDDEGNFWIATQEGLYTYNRTSGVFSPQLKNSAIANSPIFRVEDVGDGTLWIGIENDGIYRYDRYKNSLQHLTNTTDPSSLSSNTISSIYRDGTNNIWVGTYTGGVNVADAKRKQFFHYKNKPEDKNTLAHNSVLTFADGQKGIWIGTDGGGLDFFEKDKNIFHHHVAGSNSQNSISGNNVGCLLVDIDENIWCASWGAGINVVETGDKVIKHFRNSISDTASLSSDYCFEIYGDRDGKVWIGTMGGGLNLFDKKDSSFKRYLPGTDMPGSINSRLIYSIYEDSYSNLWIGTEDSGLNLFDRKSGVFTYYANEENNSQSLSNNAINVMMQDLQGSLWIGTNGGLNKFDYAKKTFEVYTEKDGLPSRVIKSMEIDDHGNLWLGTSRGISKFNPLSRTFRNYTLTDGLQGHEFNRQASLKTKTGEMYFGGNNGFNTFFPDSVRDTPFHTPIVITNFLIFNKPLTPGGEGSPLIENINEVEEITLSYTQSIFSIEFAALDCIHPDEVKYAYKLEGVDKGWNYVDNKRSATYTQLDPGDYVFMVKAGNSRGEWTSIPRPLKIVVIPPFWATVKFKLLVGLLCIGAVVAFIRIRLFTMKKQKEFLEKTVIEKNLSLQTLVKQQDKLLKEKEWLIREIHHRVKNNFHMVTGLLGTQAGYLKNEEALRAIAESQQRIFAMSLIHQKLYQSENLSAINMPDYIHELVEHLKDSFEMKSKIRFVLQIERVILDLAYSLPVALILNEAITNCIKYAFTSAENNIISISLSRTNSNQAILSISDNGNGLPAGFDVRAVKSMGINLMRGLSEDINGVFSIETQDGTRVSVAFSPFENGPSGSVN